MEVFLLEDIAGVGKRNDLLIVGDGYALNCLLPHRKALVATPTVRRRYAAQIRKRAEEKQKERDIKADAAGAIDGKELEFSRKITKTGKLYAAISEKHISEALKKDHSMEIKESEIVISEPIKTLGAFDVTLKLADSDKILKIKVEEEK
jgi:large subunit ribosomal protein L9